MMFTKSVVYLSFTFLEYVQFIPWYNHLADEIHFISVTYGLHHVCALRLRTRSGNRVS